MGNSKNASTNKSAGIGAKARKGHQGRKGPSASEAQLHRDVERAGKLASEIAKGTAAAGASDELRSLLEAELRGGGASELKRLWAALETLVSASEAKRLKSAGDLAAPTASALLSLLEGLGSDRFSRSTDPLALLGRLRGLVLKSRILGGKGEEGRQIWNHSPHRRVFLTGVPEVEDLNAAGGAFEGAKVVVVNPRASFHLGQGQVAWTTHLVPTETGRGSRDLRALFSAGAEVYSAVKVEGKEDLEISKEEAEVGLRSLCSLILEKALVPVPSGDGSEAKLRPLQGLQLVGRVYAAAEGLGEVVKASIKVEEMILDWEGGLESASARFCTRCAEAAGESGREWSLAPQRERAANLLAEAAFSAEFAEGSAAACWRWESSAYEQYEETILGLLAEGGELDAACVAAFERGVRSREEKAARAARHAEFQAQREGLKGLWKSPQLRWAKGQPEGSAARALAAQLQGHIENGRVSASAEAIALIDELRSEAEGSAKREAKAAAKAKRTEEEQAAKDWKVLYARLMAAGKSPKFRQKRREIATVLKSQDPLAARCEAARAVLGDSE